jgi:hypothetical protein
LKVKGFQPEGGPGPSCSLEKIPTSTTEEGCEWAVDKKTDKIARKIEHHAIQIYLKFLLEVSS